MSHDELPTVQQDVAHQAADELLDLGTERLGFLRKLLQRLGQPVRDPDVLAGQLALQLHVVVAGHPDRAAFAHGGHRQSA